MADAKISALTALAADPASGDLLALVDVSDTTQAASGTTKKITVENFMKPYLLGLCGGRLTLDSADPAPAADQTAKTNLYFVADPATPSPGYIALHTGGVWALHSFGTVTKALGTLTSGKNYDVFLYNNAGTLTIELVAWTNDTTRATDIILNDGIYTKNAAGAERRYLGTIRTASTTTTEDSEAKRFVWNLYNPVNKTLAKFNSSTYTYNSATIRQQQASSSHQVEVVVGVQRDAIDLNLAGLIEIDAGEWAHVGIGDNSTSAYATGSTQGTLRHFTVPAIGTRLSVWGSYTVVPRLGYSAFTMLERAESGTMQLVANMKLKGNFLC